MDLTSTPESPLTTPEVEELLREARADAWDEGARRGYTLYDETLAVVERENPYRD